MLLPLFAFERRSGEVIINNYPEPDFHFGTVRVVGEFKGWEQNIYENLVVTDHQGNEVVAYRRKSPDNSFMICRA